MASSDHGSESTRRAAEGHTGSGRSKGVLITLTVLAAPVAWGLETVLRHLIFPADFELFRGFLEPFLTPVAWVFGILAAMGSFAGLTFQRRMMQARAEKLGPDASPDAREGAALGVFLLSATIPQIPAVAATLCFMFGAAFLPVFLGVTLCTLGILVQAARIDSSLAST